MLGSESLDALVKVSNLLMDLSNLLCEKAMTFSPTILILIDEIRWIVKKLYYGAFLLKFEESSKRIFHEYQMKRMIF